MHYDVQADFDKVHAGSSADYSIFRFGANFGYLLPRDWLTKLTFSGQYSSNILVPGEQFGAGSAVSVRGFSEREVSGDCGFAGSAEIYTPNFSALLKIPDSQVKKKCRVLT